MSKKNILSLLLISIAFVIQTISADDQVLISHINLSERMDFYHCPGLSIAVIDQGKIIWANGYGNVTHEPGARPVTKETLFQAASISKSLTAYGALLLVQQGKVSLDEDINNYLQRWKVPENEYTDNEKVTLRRLLSHQAGTSVSGFPGYSISDNIPSLVEILVGQKPANSGPVRVVYTPGSKLQYSGGGTTIVQLLIEEVAKEPFESWMHKNVLLPLEMTNSTFSILYPDKTHQAAFGHLHDGKKVEGNWHIYPEKAAAGLWTTPTDLAKFVLNIQSTLRGEGTGPLKSDTVCLMTMRQHLNDGQKINLGLGLFLENESTNIAFRHSGRNEGFISNLYGFSFHDHGIVVMANNDEATGLIEEVVNSVSHIYEWPQN